MHKAKGYVVVAPTRTVSCDCRDHNRSQNAVQGYSVIRQQDHLSRPEGRQKCNEPNARWRAPNPQRAQGHREPRGGDSRLHQASPRDDSPIRAGRIHLHRQALYGRWSKMKRPTVGIATDGAHSTEERLKIIVILHYGLGMQL